MFILNLMAYISICLIAIIVCAILIDTLIKDYKYEKKKKFEKQIYEYLKKIGVIR